MTYAPATAVLGRGVAVIFLLLLGLTAALVLLSIPVGVYTVFFTHLSNSTSATTLGRPYLWLGPTALLLPITVSYGGAFLAVTVVYAGMLVVAARQGRGVLSTLRATVREGVGQLFANHALVTLIGIGFLLFTGAMIDVAVSAFGSSVGNPFQGEDPLALLLGFTLAPLREEFGFRVLIIGVAAFALSLWRSNKTALRSLWRPSTAYEGVERDTLVLVVIWVAGALSSGIFGLCHVACGSAGWDIGKLPEATYGGVVLAYLYIKYGFHVAVLGHWGVDYFGSVFAFFGQGAYGIPWNSSSEYWLQLLVDVDVLLLFGLACFLVVIYVGLRRLASGRRVQPEVTAPVGSSYVASSVGSVRES